MEHSDNGLFIKRERFEVLAILREICKQRTPLRVENQQHRFQSLLLSVGPDNIVFSGEEAENAIDGACTIVIESNDAKIEFSVGQAELTEHQGVQACSTRLPQELVYIQRRRQFRITTPHWRQFFCTGEYPDGTPYELRIHDLSAGGVGLRFDGPLPDFFQPGLQFKKAELIWAATAASRSTWSWWWSTTIRKPTITTRWCTSRACRAASSSWGWRWSAKFRARCSPSSWISTKKKR